MNVFAKVLAAIVLLGSVIGLLVSVVGVIGMASSGVLERLLADSLTAATYFGQLGFSVLMSIMTIVLTVMVLASRSPKPTPSA